MLDQQGEGHLEGVGDGKVICRPGQGILIDGGGDVAGAAGLGVVLVHQEQFHHHHGNELDQVVVLQVGEVCNSSTDWFVALSTLQSLPNIYITS